MLQICEVKWKVSNILKRKSISHHKYSTQYGKTTTTNSYFPCNSHELVLGHLLSVADVACWIWSTLRLWSHTHLTGLWHCWLDSRSKAGTSTFKQWVEHSLNIKVRGKQYSPVVRKM